MEEIQTLEKLLGEFHHAHESKGALSFFRKSPEAYYILLIVTHTYLSKNPISIEALISKVSPKYCSRQTVKNITNNAIAQGLLEKKTDKQDKRKKYFILSYGAFKEIKIWLNKTLIDYS